MKIAIIGADGQLGTDLCQALSNFEVISLTQNDIEITSTDSVKKSFAQT